MKTVTVNASRIYDVFIGAGILAQAGSTLRSAVGGQAAAIVTDDNVAALYGKQLSDTLLKNGYRVARFTFPHGESSKNAETFLGILNFLAAEKFSRADVVVALGGGVVGDLAGFAASCYMRGISFAQIPTTLLAMVDSSVGGKTAINLSTGKNLVGAFYQPNVVLTDISTLSTLPPEFFRDGCAEVIKYGVIADKELFESLDRPIEEQLEKVVSRCVNIKSDIVAQDEHETGTRKLLNFGHTIGHAIELLSGYKTSHGFAVAAGMATVARAAVRMGVCDAKCADSILRVINKYGLPDNLTYEASQIADACLSDKKRAGESVTMVFPVEIGRCVLRKIPIKELITVIQLGLEQV
ncbi:MAG: 3-dehydroquinate synthase [Oscillospiraceae bacterium]|nr:3-dehydroquinate synthase [Oscillospiraceae bacterium]